MREWDLELSGLTGEFYSKRIKRSFLVVSNYLKFLRGNLCVVFDLSNVVS